MFGFGRKRRNIDIKLHKYGVNVYVEQDRYLVVDSKLSMRNAKERQNALDMADAIVHQVALNSPIEDDPVGL